MQNDEIKTLFDQQAADYDERWARTAPIRDGLHFLLGAVFAELPPDARILCVGVGTGEEMAYLAQRFPQWRFTAVEPSGAMLEVCRAKAEKAGFVSRCEFHEGFLDTLPEQAPFDGATSFLVSQFILDRDARTDYFHGIAQRLRPGGLLASSELAFDTSSNEYEALLRTWLNMMRGADVAAAAVEQMRAAYAKDVAILPPQQVADIIKSAGFDEVMPFYQAGLIQAWVSRRVAV